MEKRLLILCGLGIVLIVVFFYIYNRETGYKLIPPITLEPTYEGETLTYWMSHWYEQYGRPNIEAHVAMASMGLKAAPYLGERMVRREMIDAGTPNFNYYEPLVQAFQILGSNAVPAVPYLIQSLGRNFGASEKALASIGPAAVPTLAAKLVNTLSDTNNPFYFGGIRLNVRKESGYFIRGQILQVFNALGTNAEAALPALSLASATNLPCFTERIYEQNVYATFARVGLNHLGMVIPVLQKKFTNAPSERADVAKALAISGPIVADAVLPTLISGLADQQTDEFGRHCIADTLSVIGVNHQNILVPVLLSALGDASNTEQVRCSIANALAHLGTNQPDLVVPALTTAYTNSSLTGRSSIAGALACFPRQSRFLVPAMLDDCKKPNPKNWGNRWRISLILAIRKIAPDMPGTLEPLLQDLKNNEPGFRQQTIYALGDMGTNALDAVPALLNCLSHSDAQTRIDTIRTLNRIGVQSDEYIQLLGKVLTDSNEFAMGEAYETLGKFAGRSKLAFVTLMKKGIFGDHNRDWRWQAKNALINVSREDATFMLECLNDSDAQVRSGALTVFYDLERGVPQAIPKLRELASQDSDPDVRSRAADVLKLQLQ